MRKIRENLRLFSESRLSRRQIASCCGISKTTVSECLERAQRIGLDWSAMSELSDEELERQLYPPAAKVPVSERPTVDWAVYGAEEDGHYYSVPYQLVSQQLDVRMTAKTVECFTKSRRVASHLRSFRRGAHTTQGEHMPRPHREYAQWTPERLVRWAQKAGPSVEGLVETVMATRVHPQHGFRSCLGILRLGERYGFERLEAACRRALEIGAASYRSVASILKGSLDQQESLIEPAQPLAHENLRGASYYQTQEEGGPC